MSFSVAGVPASAVYSAAVFPLRMTAVFAQTLRLPISSDYTVTLSVTWVSGSQAFTCVIDFLIDQDRRPFDVVLGFDWFQYHPSGSPLPVDEINISVSSLRFMFDFDL
jgi:hypothetical protein